MRADGDGGGGVEPSAPAVLVPGRPPAPAVAGDEKRPPRARDVAERRYFVTGDLTEEIFADDCRFIDPTTKVTGLSRYLRALRALFDPSRSEVELVGALRRTAPNVIEGDYRAEGT